MKQVTDSFINMQTETTTQEKDLMSQMLIVEWCNGLNWKASTMGESCRDGNLMDEYRKYNAEIAKEYLKSNVLTYEDWVVKYKLKTNI